MNPIDILNQARRAVPALDYALALAGIAACASIVIGFVGSGAAGFRILFLTFAGVILVFLFAKLASSQSMLIYAAGIVMLWSVLLSFVAYLILTFSVILGNGPEVWARVMGLDDKPFDGVRKAEDLLAKNVPLHLAPVSDRVFDQPQIGGRKIDGCILSPFFPSGFGEQCRVEAQKIIATVFCRQFGFTRRESHSTNMNPFVSKAYVLRFDELPGDRIYTEWMASDTAGFLFTQIHCS